MPFTSGRLEGYTQLLVKMRALPRAQQTALRGAFRAIGRLVSDRGAENLEQLRPAPDKTAEGFRPYVRLRGVEVDQTLRKTTGLRPDWGATQMTRALLPALDELEPKIAEKVDEAMTAAAKAVDLL